MNEFEEQIKQMKLGSEATGQVLKMIAHAGEEFPCLSCPSKDECGSFKWFVKWFGGKSK